MIISHSRRFIFVHIHKTGGDSVATALRPVLNASDVVLTNDWHDWLTKFGPSRDRPELTQLRKHSPARAIAAVVPPEMWDGSFKFAFVRHPVARTVSLYKYAARKAEERRRLLPRNIWYLTPPGRSGDPLRWHSVRAYLETSTFSEFIRHPLLDQDLAMSPQWLSLSAGTGDMLVDFVGRFESLQQDFDHILERIDVARLTLGWQNASRGRGETVVSSEDRAYLAQRFEDDFVHFGYDPSQDS